MTRARYRGVLGLTLSLALLLAACGGGDDEGGDTAASAGGGSDGCESVDTLVLGYPGLPPDFVQMVTPLAAELGYFADNCLEVEFVGTESGIAAFRAMAAGEFDASFSGSVSPILAYGEGADAVVFGSPGALTDFQIVATGDIDSCEDLAGSTVATDGPGGLQHAITELFMTTCGLDINEDVELIIGDPETFPAQIAQGAVQATTMHIDERILAEQELDTEFNILGNSWEEFPTFHYGSYSTAIPVLEEKRDQFVRFMAAILQTGQWLQDESNRDEAIQVMGEVSEQPENVVVEAFELFGSRFPATCDEALDLEAYQYLIDLQADLGNLPEAYTAEDLVDVSVCADAETLNSEQGA
jgi:ABC-type nitrate/sulfonate/bicarbonate transport system substrate-binding protein